VACFLQAHALHPQGRWAQAHEWLARGLALLDAQPARPDGMFAADPEVVLLGTLAIELVRSGRLRQARGCLQRAAARADALRQPMTRLAAAWHECLVEVRLGQVDRLSALAADMQLLVDEFALEQGRTASRWFRGWVQARQGRAREGYLQIREAYERNIELGMRAGASEVLGYAAEALLLDGDADAARDQLRQALRLATDLSEGVYLTQLLLLDAAIARAQGRAGEAAAAARRAVDTARAQQAPFLELLALADLCEHHDAGGAERQALADLVDAMPEAGETAAVRRARSLLALARSA